MITADEARQIYSKRQLKEVYPSLKEAENVIAEIERLIQLKAADGGNHIVYDFTDRRLVDLVAVVLIANGYVLDGGFPTLTIHW